MATRFQNPFTQFADTTGLPYSGGSLSFYATSSSTPLATYSDAGLSVANSIYAADQHIILNSAGRPSVAIFLQNLPYKVTLRDVNGNVIWTADPVTSSDFSSFAIWKVGSGSPTGSVAGTQGSSGVLPTVYFDYLNAVVYVCTSTGSASTAVWASINATATTAPVLTPQGRLTLTSATPIISAEVTAATSVYYTPFNGNLAPIYNGSAFVNTTFAELTLSLVASHTASSIYDVFVFLNPSGGAVTVGTGPAWSTSTAGSGARGTGAGTTQLTRLNGLLVNAQQITARNGSTTYTVAGNYATYVGSLFMDGTNGQISCHNTYGQSRKWGVWNAFNRSPITLQMGDATATWTYNTATIRQSRADATNTLATFCGLAEESVDITFAQNATLTNANSGITVGIGVNSTTVNSGLTGTQFAAGSDTTQAIARHILLPTLGLNNINSTEKGTGNATSTWNGGNDDMLMMARWLG